MFLRKDRMEKAYKKHLQRFKKKSQEPEKFTKKISQEGKKSPLPKGMKTKEIHRDFTSFGSKMRTTPSTSKRSSNDIEKTKTGEKSSYEYIPQNSEKSKKLLEKSKYSGKSPLLIS